MLSAGRTAQLGPPNMRVQRTRSSASPPHSPLTRRPLGRLGQQIVGVLQGALLATSALGSVPTLVSASPDTEAETFVLDSTQSTYPFALRLEGAVKRNGDTIEVDVKRGEIRSAIPADLGDEGRATDVIIAFGLGRSITDGWQMIDDTEPQAVSAELRPGESLPVTPHRFVIKGLSGSPVVDMWLAARLTVTQELPGIPAGPLSSYACSETNLLGSTPGSRDRAKRMA